MKNVLKHYTRPGSKINRYKAICFAKLAELGLIGFVDTTKLNKYFLISTGRTGTRFLANFLNLFEINYAVHEPLPNLLAEGNDFARNRISAEEIKKKYLAGRQIYFKEILKNRQIKKYIESNNRLYSFIPVIRELYPESKFIHVVRDGRDVVRSGMSRHFYTKQDKTYRISADLIPDDPYFEKWNNMDQFEKICWWWQKKDSMIFNDTYSFEDSILIKFEEIFNQRDGYPGIKRILSFLNIENVSDDFIKSKIKKVNETKSFAVDHWKNWDEDKLKKFDTIAGNHMRKLGYVL